MTKVKLFEIIRRDYFIHEKSIRRIARERSIHRRQVRQAIESAIPPERAETKRRCIVLTPGIKHIIDQIILDDQTAPRKQRHTAKRVHTRLIAEHEFKGSLSSVAQYFGKQRRGLCLQHNVFVPQMHAPGEEAEVDWYEAMVDFPDGRKKVYFFQMRACFSGFEFHMAFERQNQQSFLEGHVAAFQYFGGVFKTLVYDNLSSAVKKVLKGRKRIETEKFITLRSHYLFEALFCMPGIRGAHEKGGVEGGVGRFRRAHLVPVPKVNNLSELNALLLAACAEDAKRQISGKDGTVLARWQIEQSALKPLPSNVFDTDEVLTPKVNNKSLAPVKGNYYSVPTVYVSQSVEARVGAREIKFYARGKQIAVHLRSYDKGKTIATLDHYLGLLRKKPGALPGSLPLAQARAQLCWPALYDRYWEALRRKNDENEANRLFVDFLWWARDFNDDVLTLVLARALDSGCYHLDALKALMRQIMTAEAADTEKLSLESLGELAHYERPVSHVHHYDQLLLKEVRS